MVFDGFDLGLQGGALGQESLSLEHEFGDGHDVLSFGDVPMTPALFWGMIYEPSASVASGLIVRVRDPAADVMLMAIAGQESGWRERVQLGGPARSFWQFEEKGGVAEVLGHRLMGLRAQMLVSALRLPSDRKSVYEIMAWNDVLAVGMARMLLWADPHGLPLTAEEGWACYLRQWRPGKPHEKTWVSCWDESSEIVREAWAAKRVGGLLPAVGVGVGDVPLTAV